MPRLRPGRLSVLVSLVLAGCAVAPVPGSEPAVTLLFAGDIMLGRGVTPIVDTDPESLFQGVRFVVTGADLAFANLESPLTRRPHVGPSYALEADPSTAPLLAGAGFDVVSIANNHAGDGGPPSITDTIDALAAAGLLAVGGGSSFEAAGRPALIDAGSVIVAALAFDVSGAGLPAGEGPGILRWNDEVARPLVEQARGKADVVTVSIHGGTEYQTDRDPSLWVVAETLAGWGVDVVWGHGPHVVQDIEAIDPDGDGRYTVVATSLGNFLFDQDQPGTTDGAILEVLAGGDGVHAYRVGGANHADSRVGFTGWELPPADAVLVGVEWWTLLLDPQSAPEDLAPLAFAAGEMRSHGFGDVTGDGEQEVVVSFRRPFRETELTKLFPEKDWTDEQGRSVHLGVYRPSDLRQWWVAGSLFRPIEELVVCDGSIAVVYSDLDDPTPVATGGWRWRDFGFVGAPELLGPGVPGCIDVDGDGQMDPAILDRSPQIGKRTPAR